MHRHNFFQLTDTTEVAYVMNRCKDRFAQFLAIYGSKQAITGVQSPIISIKEGANKALTQVCRINNRIVRGNAESV